MTTPGDVYDQLEWPAAFERAAASLRGAPPHEQIRVEEIPAPRRLAPYALAFAATVGRSVRPRNRAEDESELAGGRLVVLHDPDGQAGWSGTFRLVAYVRAGLELEIATDPLLGRVGWSWLTEALEERGARYAGASGTVTRAISEGFGDKGEDENIIEFELRASWSPVAADDLSSHYAAWCDVLCAAAGVPPSGVVSLRGDRD